MERALRIFRACGLLLGLLLLAALPAVAEAPAEARATGAAPPSSSTAARAVGLLASGDREAARALLATAEDGPETDMARGLLAELDGDAQAAARLYRRASASFPAEAAFRLGNLALASGRPREAAERYLEALRRDPDQAMTHYNLALALDALGRTTEALSHVERALELDPPEAWNLVRAVTRGRHAALEVTPVNLLRSRALVQRGRMLRALGRSDEGESWQAAADTAGTEPLDPLLRLGEAAALRRDTGEAALWLEAFLESSIEPTGVASDVAVWGPGAIRVTMPGGRIEEVRTLRLGVEPSGRLIRVGGGSLGIRLPGGSHGMEVGRDGTVRVWQEGARVPRAVGRLPLDREGVELLAGYRERDPRAARAWALLRGLGPEIESLVRVLPFLPSSRQVELLAPLADGPLAPLVRARLGTLYFRQFQVAHRLEDLHEARRQWQALRRGYPDLQFPILNLATLALLERQFDEVRELLEALRDKHPDRTLPDQLLVQLHMARQDWQAATAAADEQLRRTPNAPFPQLAKAEILAARDLKPEALAATEALLARNPGLVEARYLLVRLLGRMGNLQRQQDELERLLELDPTPYRARRMLASLLDRLGRTEAALEHYRLYLASPEALVYETEEWVATEVRVRQLQPR